MAHSSIKRLAMLSLHTCPLVPMGGRKAGGMNVYVRNLARMLAKTQTVQVDIFTRSQDPSLPMISDGIGYGGRVIHIPTGPQIPLSPTEISRYIDEFIEGVDQFTATENEGERTDYDLIHSHYWLSGLAALQLSARWNNIPVVHMFHTLEKIKTLIALSDEGSESQKRLNGEMSIVSQSDIIIAATRSEQDHLLRYYNAAAEQIRILPPGIDLDHFHPIPQAEARQRLGIPMAEKIILFVGRVEPLKGIDILLTATGGLKKNYRELLPELKVMIIGGDSQADPLEAEMARLQAMSHDLQIDDWVVFAGAKDQGLLPDYYAAADIVVMPSHYESFGMVALEAMAMGRAVIVSQVGGLAHLVSHRETGLQIPPGDAEALTAHLFELLNDDQLRHKLGIQAQHCAQQYSWQMIGNHMLEIYSGLYTEVT